MSNDDIWSSDNGTDDNEIISSAAVESSDSDMSDGVVLDLSEDADLGSDYPTIPLKTYVHTRVFEAMDKTSQAGNRMYAIVLQATDDTWGKNRKLRYWITLSTKALNFTLPSLAALGVPAQFNGQPVATMKELRNVRDSSGGSGNLVFPSVQDLLDRECYAYIGKHEEDENDDEKVWERVTKLVHVDNPKAKIVKEGTASNNSSLSNPYSG